MEDLTCRAVSRPPSVRVVSRTTPRGASPGLERRGSWRARVGICSPEYSHGSRFRAAPMVPVGKVVATLPQRPRSPHGPPLRSIQDRRPDAAGTEMRPDRRADEVDRHVRAHRAPAARATTSSRNASTSGLIVWRIASRSIGRSEMSSIRRSRALDRVRTLSTVSTTPSLTRMIGLTDSSVPMAACAPLIRPPFLQVLERLEGDVDAHVARARLEDLGDLRGRPPLGGELDRHPGEDALGHRRAERVDDVDLAVGQHVAGRSGRS